MAIRISRRSNTYDARNNRLTSRYLFLPYSDFGFRIMDLGSRFMAFPLSKKSNPAKDCSWNYYRDSLGGVSYFFFLWSTQWALPLHFVMRLVAGGRGAPD